METNLGVGPPSPLVFVLYLLGTGEVLLLFGAGLVYMLFRNAPAFWRRPAQLSPWPLLLLVERTQLPALAAPSGLVTLFLLFLKIGSVLYGSGYVLLAFLQNDFVERFGWLTNDQLIDAVAVGQSTPGPVFTTATFIGFLLGSWWGALLATGRCGPAASLPVQLGLAGDGWWRRRPPLLPTLGLARPPMR